MLDEGGERGPNGGIHVEMCLVLDVLVVDFVRIHSLGAPPQQSEEKERKEME
jgi:hypothetical protein